MRKGLSILLVISGITLLPGCNIIRMTGAPHSSNVGRQLLDLHEAKEKGLITEQEYDQLKALIMESWVNDDEPALED